MPVIMRKIFFMSAIFSCFHNFPFPHLAELILNRNMTPEQCFSFFSFALPRFLISALVLFSSHKQMTKEATNAKKSERRERDGETNLLKLLAYGRRLKTEDWKFEIVISIAFSQMYCWIWIFHSYFSVVLLHCQCVYIINFVKHRIRGSKWCLGGLSSSSTSLKSGSFRHCNTHFENINTNMYF